MRYSLSFVLSLTVLSQGVQASQGVFFLSDDTPLSFFLSPISSFDEVITGRAVVASPDFSSGDANAHAHVAESEDEDNFMNPWASSSHTTPVPAWVPEMFFESEDKLIFVESAAPSQNLPVENAVLSDEDNFPPLLRDDVPSLPKAQEERPQMRRPHKACKHRISPKRLAHQAIVNSAKNLIRDLEPKDLNEFKGKNAKHFTTKILEVVTKLNASDTEKYTLLSYAAQLCLNAQNHVKARWCVDQILCAKRAYVLGRVAERTDTVDAILLVYEQ